MPDQKLADVALQATGPLRAPSGDPATAGVVVEDLAYLTKLTLRCEGAEAAAAALGVRFGRAIWRGELLRIGAGPDEWYIIGPSEYTAIRDQLRNSLAAVGGLVTMLDVSHGRALFRLRGPRVLDLLSRVTAFDLDDRFVPDGSAFRTSVAAVVTDVVRDDIDGPSYVLHCERSSGRWLVDTLLAAGADLGTAVVPGDWPGHPTDD